MPGPLVLASTSRYRAELMATLGLPFTTAAPGVDERALDHRFDELGAEGYVLELARAKARAVAAEHPDAVIVGGDQAAVLTVEGADVLLHQPGGRERAVAQLMEMSGSTHRLVNGLVVLDAAKGVEHHEIDVHRITMRPYTLAEATAYVERFEPYDCAGGYRLEDDADLIASVEGEDPSGVIGLPLPSLRRLLAAVTGRER